MSRTGERLTAWGLLALALMLPVSIAGINIALGIITAGVLLSRRPDDAKALKNPVFLWLVFYAASGAASALFGLHPTASITRVPRDLHKVWAVGALILAFRRPAPDLARPLALGFALAALVGIYQTASAMAYRAMGVYFDGLYTVARMRAHGFAHPTTYGALMAVGILGSVSFMNAARLQTVWRGLGPAMVLALVFSQTRAAFLALGGGFLSLALVSARARRLLPLAVLLGAAGVAVNELMPGGRSLQELASTLSQGAKSPHWQRLDLWKAAWGMFTDYPWLGIGLGNYGRYFGFYIGDDIEGRGAAHNLFLHQMAERGLIGLIALVGLFYCVFRSLYRTATPANRLPEAVWAWSGWAAFLLVNMTEVSFQTEQMATLMLFLWAWAVSPHKVHRGL